MTLRSLAPEASVSASSTTRPGAHERRGAALTFVRRMMPLFLIMVKHFLVFG